MSIILRIAISLLLAAVAAALIALALSGNPLAIHPMVVAIVFVACFSTALLSPAIANIGGTAPGISGISDRGGQRERGIVKWFNVSKGYGFITRANGEEIFVHFRSIKGKGRQVLRDGQSVEFEVGVGEKGPQAENVAPVSTQ